MISYCMVHDIPWYAHWTGSVSFRWKTVSKIVSKEEQGKFSEENSSWYMYCLQTLAREYVINEFSGSIKTWQLKRKNHILIFT